MITTTKDWAAEAAQQWFAEERSKLQEQREQGLDVSPAERWVLTQEIKLATIIRSCSPADASADICAEMAREAATQAAKNRSEALGYDEFALATAAQFNAQADALREAERRIRADIAPTAPGASDEQVYRDAALLVCGYCDGHFTEWEREARRGAVGSGNWIHRDKGDASRSTLCSATGIYNKLSFQRSRG